MRAAVHAHALGHGRAFALAAFRVHFAEGRALSEEAGLAHAARRAGLDPDDLLAATAAPDVKDRLRALTAAALDAGVTGVPSVRVGDAVVWGDDRLEEAAALARRRAAGPRASPTARSAPSSRAPGRSPARAGRPSSPRRSPASRRRRPSPRPGDRLQQRPAHTPARAHPAVGELAGVGDDGVVAQALAVQDDVGGAERRDERHLRLGDRPAVVAEHRDERHDARAAAHRGAPATRRAR